MICSTTQTFGQNTTPANIALGLKGHPGDDIDCGYGSPIECPLDIEVYKIIDDKHPSNDGTGYWAVFGIGQYKGQWGELCIGHLSPVAITFGPVKKGSILGFESNKGLVYSGSIQITKAMQDAGDQRGHHRHWQWRSLKKTQFPGSGIPKLTAYPLSVYRDKDNYAYEIPDFYNGYNGCSSAIEDILGDYDKWKFEQSIINNISTTNVPTQAQKNSIMRALAWLKEILIKLKK